MAALPTVQSNELRPGTPVSEYLIEKRLGEGAMGAVYVAQHPKIGKRVAIKIMNPRLSGEPESVERFVGEARAVAAIRHPGIVDVFGFGSLADGRLYLVMELLHGESLRERMERGRLDFAEALDVLDQMALGLDAAHDHGIILGDLKPENVFLERVAKVRRPIVKILDFGLAKLIDGNDGRVRRTQTGQLLGTPLYMSPEQCRAKSVDHRTDIYALGCVAYEMLCGRVPFDFDNVAELIAAHLGQQPPPPRELWPEIPAALDGLLYAMLAKDSARRPTLEQIRETISNVPNVPVSSMSSRMTPPSNRWQAPVPQSQRPRAAASVDEDAVTGRPAMVARTTLGASTGELQAVRPRSRTRLVLAASASVVIVAALVGVMASRDRHVADEPMRHEPEAISTPPAPSITPMLTTQPSSADTATESIAAKTTQMSGSAAVDTKAGSKPNNKPRITSPRVERDAPCREAESVGERIVKPNDTATDVRAAPEKTAGSLMLASKPPCDIYVDGNATGLRTPQREIRLDAGHHSITLINTEFAIKNTFTIEVKPGETVRQTEDYSDRIPAGKTTINPFKKHPSP